MKARLQAAIRLLYPDEMTPTARNVLLRILEEETIEAVPTGAASLIPQEES
jgi:hypothetical protein